MKAEESNKLESDSHPVLQNVFEKYYRPGMGGMVDDTDVFKIAIEYARIEIEKDRERVKAKARKADHFNAFVYVSDIDETRIELD